MSENSNYDLPIRSKRPREALIEASTVLGRAAEDTMLNDLELNGITLRDRPDTLRELRNALRKVWL
ncbi:MAG TPA: hypothetical protein VJZ68_08315 [Nitrososphaera sp.]|nr:hypothetical protein [Nitrososphaera sp.]